MKTLLRIALHLTGIALAGAPQALGAEPAALARDLLRTGEHAAAAVEFRRLALTAPASESASWYWMAARSYLHIGDPARATAMLDRLDDTGLALRAESSLLRAEVARAAGDPVDADFYFRSALPGLREEALRRFTQGRLAELAAQGGDLAAARAALPEGEASQAARAALEAYAAGRDKSPRLGGTLGLIPGLGYAYAGEYANAVRCLILNSLFLYGMARFAEEEQWGGFAVVTFFELTWYSGSIYGGFDAAHRYNQRRFDTLTRELGASASLEPDPEVLPALRLRVLF
jgi:hypothetical protein